MSEYKKGYSETITPETALTMSDEDLLDEFGTEEWAADRTVGMHESQENARVLSVLRTEILKRMKIA
jgi:hypothetical protein